MKKKGFLFRFIFILIFIGFGSGNVSSFGSENPFLDGVALFNTGQFQTSYDLFLKAFENEPENLDLNFYLGRAAFEIGHYEMAIMAFERILISSPRENRVKLEIARAFQKLGANNTSVQYCLEVLASNPPEAVKKNIQSFIAHIKKTEQTHFLNGQLSAGIDRNNNIWASPSVGTINTIIGNVDLTGASSRKTRDWIYTSTLGIQHAYRLPLSNHFWKTEATLYNAVYDKTSALDIQYIGGNTGPEFVSGKNRWGFRFLFSHIDLGNTEYQDSLGFKLLLDHSYNPYFQGRTALKVEEKNFPNNPGKDAKNLALSHGMNYLLHRNWISIGFKAEQEYADDDENSYKRYGSNVSISRELPFDMTGSAGYAYQFSTYSKPGSLFNKNREDHQHSAGAGLKKILWKSSDNPARTASLNLNYQHIWAFSNIELYEYEQDLVQLFLLYAF